ncbi:MAG TPA: RsmE family RNA methyltransferase [Verrucomicrobiae bacterium]
MHRFYLPPESCAGPVLSLDGSEAHHALHVLRVRRGDTVTVLNGAGGQCLCEVQDCGRDSLNLKVFERHQIDPLPFQVTLIQALPKGKGIEAIIQKSTELGVYRLVPLLTERVVSHLHHESSGDKTAKWRSVAVEAIKQCGSTWLPQVEEPLTPEQLLSQSKSPELALVGALEGRSKHPREYFQSFINTQGRKPASVSVWVGPEGDFTPSEMELIQSSGVLPISLGPLVLRSETAAICSLSVIFYELRSPVGT